MHFSPLYRFEAFTTTSFLLILNNLTLIDQLIIYDHFTLPTSVFCNANMLGEQAKATASLSHTSSVPFLAHLSTSIINAATTFPSARASSNLTKGRSLAHSQVLTPNQVLVFVTHARNAFDEHQAGFKLALRLFRRVALFVRTHVAEVRANVSVLLEGALSGGLLENELGKVATRIESVSSSLFLTLHG